MRKTVYYLGNPLVSQDRLPLKIIPGLKKILPDIEFIHLDPTEEIPQIPTKELILIDTVVGINKVAIFKGLDHWAVSPRNSVHDFDLPLSLGILRKLEKINKVVIIGIPEKGNEETILQQIESILLKLIAKKRIKR